MPIPPATRDAQRPNILWICTDSQRWDTLGCLGNRHVRTPRLDQLASEGVLCTHAFTQSPLCTPSRGSFLTGRYPVTNRLRQNGQICPTDIKPITKTLQEAGYVCGLSGKLHLNHCDQRLSLGAEWWREDQARWKLIGAEQRIDDGYSEFNWDHSANGEDPSSDYVRWLHDQGVSISRAPHPECPTMYIGPDSQHHQVTWCVDRAISFLQRQGSTTNPWLFSVNCFDPHFIVDPPRDYLDRYMDNLDAIPLPDVVPGELDSKPLAQRTYRDGNGKSAYRDLTDRQKRLMTAGYWAMCDHIDAQMGRLLDALDASGQRDSTLVLFHSDHGELLGDHGCYVKDQFFYDCSIRVPLIARWPGHILPGQVCEDLIELTDVAPALLQACQLPVDPAMQGHSVWPRFTGQKCQLTGREYQARDSVYCEFLGANPRRGTDAPRYATMIRTKTHKLVRVHGGKEGELYDLIQDPGEHLNRWDDPNFVAIKCDLLAQLSDRQAYTADPLPHRVGVY